MTTKFSVIKNNFTSGEISPKAHSRNDLSRFSTGLSTCQNMIISTLGGAYYRPGTVFVSEVKDSTKTVRLIEFTFNADDTYCIEVGHQYMRFYRQTQQIRVDKNITGITKANPAVVTSNSHGFSNGDHVYISGVGGMVEVNSSTRRYTVAGVTANTFQLSGIDSTSFTTYTSGGIAAKVYEISTPYDQNDIFDIHFVQSADKIYLVHPDYAPRTLTRSDHDDWTLTALMKDDHDPSATVGIFDGPYLDINNTNTSLISSAATGNVVITATSTDGINNGDGFLTTDVGRFIRMSWTGSPGVWYWLEITGHSSSTVVGATIQDGATIPTSYTELWQLGAFSRTTGFPATCTFFEDKLILASTRGDYDARPDQFHGSETQSHVEYGPGTDSTSPYSWSMNTGSVNFIQWLSPHGNLRIGTNSGIIEAYGAGESVISNTAPPIIRFTSQFRCSNIQPINIEDKTLFWDKSNTVLGSMRYDFDLDAKVVDEASVLAEHITGDGIIQFDYQQRSESVIWSVRSDGILIGTTWRPQDDIIAFHKHSFGGTDSKCKSICTVTTGSKNDRIWAVISRTINGSTKQYVEYFSNPHTISSITTNSLSVPEQCVYSDSHFSYTGERPSTTLTPAAITGSSVNFTAGSSTFSSSDIGRHIRSGTGLAIITGYTSDTVVTANIVYDFSSTSAISSGDWSLSVDSVSDLHHLEGQTVSVITDGSVHNNVTVTNGSIDLEYQATYIGIGLSYTGILETLNHSIETGTGSSNAARSDIVRVYIDVYESSGVSIGKDSSHIKNVVFRNTSDIMNLGTPLFTGVKEFTISTGFSDNLKLYMQHDKPLPLYIRSFTIKGLVSDGTF